MRNCPGVVELCCGRGHLHGRQLGDSCWRISRVLTSRQLQFRDDRETAVAFADVQGSVEAAQVEAGR